MLTYACGRGGGLRCVTGVHAPHTQFSLLVGVDRGRTRGRASRSGGCGGGGSNVIGDGGGGGGGEGSGKGEGNTGEGGAGASGLEEAFSVGMEEAGSKVCVVWGRSLAC
jgi:hypothetical protein